jgi:CHAD domain-containing protein/CYTH domain-containing protein
MSSHPDLLAQPVERAARIVALDLLDSAAKARKRLDDASDADALHDFRVGVRRLRNWLRALRPWLGDSTPKAARRRLKKAARLTGDSRDAEVHREWILAQRGALSVRQRRGLAWLLERVENEKRDSDQLVSTKGVRAFDRAHSVLARKLKTYRTKIDGHADELPRPLASVTAELVRSQAEKLSKRLARIESYEDARRVHKARLAGKRLRYLLEPIAEPVEGVARLVSELGDLQDVLGSWHDVHVFSEAIAKANDSVVGESQDNTPDIANPAATETRSRDIGLGLLALSGRLQERGRRAFGEVRERWPDADRFVEQAEAIAETLDACAGRGREIERKYLLSQLPQMPNGPTVAEIDQGYIPGTNLLERLRRVRTPHGGGDRCIRTLKAGDGLVRTEIEEEIPAALFERMWPLTEGRRLRKRRYAIREGGHIWEVDEFLDRELVLAEVELSSVNDEVPIPDWLGAVLVREVTEEKAYTNASLASGDRGTPEQMEKELQHEDRGDGGGERSGNGSRASHEARTRSARLSLVEPAVGEPPRT